MYPNKLTTIVLIFSATLFSLSVRAEVVKIGLPACLSEDLLDEMIGYSVKNDRNGMMQLLNGSCIFLKEGSQVSVISPGFVTACIRYKGVKLYTPKESIR